MRCVVVKYCFFIQIFFILVESIVNIDEVTTFCDGSANFSQLENFIGAFHQNAPRNVKIHVAYRNLTEWELNILSLYQNVDSFVIQNLLPHSLINFIPLTDELIDFENRKIHRRKEKARIGETTVWPYVDSIRKKTRLVVIIPFIRQQLDSVREQLKMSLAFKPCKSKTSADLIFYHNEGENSSIIGEIEVLVKSFRRSIDQCFEKVKILEGNLSGVNDSYLLGSGTMWKNLIDVDAKQSLYRQGYTHFFLMEHDTRPIRNYWLDKVYQVITNGRNEEFLTTEWWVLGSSYRGVVDIDPHHSHVNGNAIYHLSSNFISFIRYFWPIYLTNLEIGYDDALTIHYSYERQYSYTWRSIFFRFRYSDFIHNCWHSCYLAQSQNFIHDNPQTFLVHGISSIQTPPTIFGSLRKIGKHFRSVSFNNSLVIVCLLICLLGKLGFIGRLINRRLTLKSIELWDTVFHRSKSHQLGINGYRG